MNITIEPLDLRTATWVAANMRPIDEAEILCQLPPGTERSDAGMACFFATGEAWRWQVSIDGSPVACFGVSQLTHTTWIGWGYGRPQMRRAMPEVTRFLKRQLPGLIAAGCRRIEARALKSHGEAHLWLRSLGGRYRFDLPDAGRNGETFEFWSWHISEGTEMSYSFSIKAATKSEAKAKVAEELSKVVTAQPVHQYDRAAAQASADAFTDLLADDEAQDVSLSVSGWLSWNGGTGAEQVKTANVTVTASLTAKQ